MSTSWADTVEDEQSSGGGGKGEIEQWERKGAEEVEAMIPPSPTG